MLKLSWLSPDTTGHGYATIGKKYHKVMQQHATILPGDAFGWDALLIFCIPIHAYMLGPHMRPDIVFHTMTETNVLPQSWVDVLNRVGLAWVPSQFAYDVFVQNGVTTPIIKVGYGVEGTPQRREIHDHIRVLAWGDSLYSRKNIHMAIEAFIAADLPDASLEIKLNIGANLPSMYWNDGKKTYDNIMIHHASWNEHRLADWIAGGDFGLYLSSGEGYGLMPKELMVTGLPMISVRHTGMLEYLRPEHILEIPSQEQESEFFNQRFHVSGATEYHPDFNAVVEQLRYAATHREAMVEMGMAGAAYVQSFTWDSVGRQAIEQLVRHYA